MSDPRWAPSPHSVPPPTAITSKPGITARPRHSLIIRTTHWITTLSFLALLLTGVEILISHPRFYWGETGNVLTTPLFQLPIPASRSSVPTGYGFVMPDQNGWSRSLHFQAAWVLVLTGIVYVSVGVWRGHFQQHIVPAYAELKWKAISSEVVNHLRLGWKDQKLSRPYNVIQKLTYLLVIFVLFPLVIWTGLAMSPAIASAAPAIVEILGGQQSARTIHFFVSVLLTAFLIVHIGMVCLSGFRARMQAITIGSQLTTEKNHG